VKVLGRKQKRTVKSKFGKRGLPETRGGVALRKVGVHQKEVLPDVTCVKKNNVKNN